MKSVVAAKRAAARAGGMGVKGKGRAVVARVLAMFCLLSALLLTDAAAQESAWTSPTARLLLRYESGWTALPRDRSPADHRVVFAIEHRGFQTESRRMRVCWVMENPLDLPEPLSQAAANGLVAMYTTNPESAAGESITFLGQQNGVQLVEGQKDRDGMRRRTRRFFLAAGGNVTEVIVSCSAGTPLSDAEVASVDQVLNSLSILPEAKP